MEEEGPCRRETLALAKAGGPEVQSCGSESAREEGS